MDINTIRVLWVALGGALGGVIGFLYGEVPSTFYILMWCMLIDYISGIVIAVIFKASPKSSNGALDSRVGLKGLFRKAGIFVAILVCRWIDVMMNTSFVMEAATVAFIVNELISIVENLGIAGVPIPKLMRDALTQLEQQSGKDE